jgi:Peptidase_C39 like family
LTLDSNTTLDRHAHAAAFSPLVFVATACKPTLARPPTSESGTLYSQTTTESQQKRLRVPYFCQMDNVVAPAGLSCSNTSLAMVAAFYGMKSISGKGTLADQIYSRFGLLRGWELIAPAAEKMGFKVKTSIPGTSDSIKDEINLGRPVIVGGDFVGKMGHFVVVTGYDQTGFWVNDPYGEWDQKTVSPANGYQFNCFTGETGENRHYSYSAMDLAAGKEGFHLIFVRP